MASKWKEFERLAYEIQKELAPDAEVTLDVQVLGHDSKTDRQVDISIKRSAGQFSLLIALECKDHKSPVDLPDLESFATKIKDIRANKGAMVSSNGFTEAALTAAKQYGIDMFRLIDTENKDWKAYATLPMMMIDMSLKAFYLEFSGSSQTSTQITLPAHGDFQFAELIDDSGTSFGPVLNILGSKWRDGGIPHEPGTHAVLLTEKGGLSGFVTDVRIVAHVLVERTCYFSDVQVSLRGFQDMQTKGTYTKSVTTAKIEPGKIAAGDAEGWKKIDDPSKLAIRPVMEISVLTEVPTVEDIQKLTMPKPIE